MAFPAGLRISEVRQSAPSCTTTSPLELRPFPSLGLSGSRLKSYKATTPSDWLHLRPVRLLQRLLASSAWSPPTQSHCASGQAHPTQFQPSLTGARSPLSRSGAGQIMLLGGGIFRPSQGTPVSSDSPAAVCWTTSSFQPRRFPSRAHPSCLGWQSLFLASSGE
jgi:hypothetical protein